MLPNTASCEHFSSQAGDSAQVCPRLAATEHGFIELLSGRSGHDPTVAKPGLPHKRALACGRRRGSKPRSAWAPLQPGPHRLGCLLWNGVIANQGGLACKKCPLWLECSAAGSHDTPNHGGVLCSLHPGCHRWDSEDGGATGREEGRGAGPLR